MTVTTIFAATSDSDIQSSDAVYETARQGGTLVTPVATANDLYVGQLFFAGYFCYETFLDFDTSSIPDTDSIVSVELALWLTTDSSSVDFTISASYFDWGAAVTTADWRSAAQLITLDGGGTVNGPLAELSTAGIGATGAYKTFTSFYNAGANDFRTAPNMKTGNVRLVLYSRRHRNGNVPLGPEAVIFSAADVAGTGQDPKLTITHTPGAPPPFQRTTPRVWPMRGRT